MYKATVHTLVNGVVIYQKQQILKSDITQHDIAQVSMYCWAISPL